MTRTAQALASKKVLVVGLARSGRAAVDLLLDSGAKVTAADLRGADELDFDTSSWKERGAELRLGEQTAELLGGIDLVVLSPGVPLDTPVPVAARARGVPVISELELAYQVSEATWLAVTGTNGKTTTTALLGELVKKTGRPTVVAGNIGVALTSEVRELSERGLVVAEVSSFQLDTIDRFSPHVAVLLNITEDHLDRYDSFEHYVASKTRIFMNQSADDFAVLNVDDPRVASLADTLAATVIPVSGTREVENGVFVRGRTIVSRVGTGEKEIIAAQDLRIPGPHNLGNALAAVAAASAVGVEPEAAAQVLRRFHPLEHRLETVAEIDGVVYVNDSKATNVEAVSFALRSFDAPIVLIAGGRSKGADFSALADLVAEHVKRAILIGEAADAMERAFSGLTSVERVDTLHDAVLCAGRAAYPDGVVLLSPACASFDMFRDFEDRGRQFKEEVAALRRTAGADRGETGS
jgi:UDP-N-acetylmuramoylalanine--D-glutamate ligase